MTVVYYLILKKKNKKISQKFLKVHYFYIPLFYKGINNINVTLFILIKNKTTKIKFVWDVLNILSSLERV